MYPAARTLLEEVIGRFPAARKFYDVNLRKDSFTPALVERLLGLADVVKLNDGEVDAVQQMLGTSEPSLEAFCQRFGARLGWQAACVTRGDCGCAVWIAGAYHELPGYSVKVADTVGAGDAFAAAFVHGLDAGWSPREVGDFANRLGALVASRPGGVPAWTLDEVKQLA
jgi:fructokinase